MPYRKKRKRDTWVYELKDGKEIVYYGITNNPDRRFIEHANSNKRFTHINIISVALTRESALIREKESIERYKRQHSGRSPRYN